MSNARDAGYTLLEMLVVLVILGLVAAAGTTAFERRGPMMALGKAVLTTRDTLATARARAVAVGAPVVVTIEADRLTVLEHGERHTIELGRGMHVRLVSTSTGIRFYPDGSSSGGAISLGDARTRERIAVEWLTGRVDVADAQ